MSGHLSPEKISEWVLGERAPDEEQHLRDCAVCRAEVDRLQSTLAQFRSSVHQWAGDDISRARLAPGRGSTHSPARWILAAATLLILVTVPMYQNARERRHAVEQAAADAVLLEQVDQAVSRRVPRSMEPLIDLVEWGSNPAERAVTR